MNVSTFIALGFFIYFGVIGLGLAYILIREHFLTWRAGK